MRKILLACAVVLVAAIALGWVLLARPGFEPVAWQPPPNPGLTGDFAPNAALSGVSLLLPGVGRGPEDVTRGPDGYYYSGFEDGRIVRFRGALEGGHREEGHGEGSNQETAQVFVDTGGRPLGLQVDAGGRLIVADAMRGLLAIAQDGTIEVLCDSVGGRKLKLVDDLDIAGDGTIWFSDASMQYGIEDSILDLLEARPSGRLLSYSPHSGAVAVRMRQLFFANGVALGPDDTFVLVSETGAGRIQRLWLKGPRAGEQDIFIDGLPGHPDNLSFNGLDTFWLALPALRQPLLDRLARWPNVRKLLAALPRSAFIPREGYGFVIGLGLDGRVVANLQGPGGHYHTITSVNEWDGRLLLGSLTMSAVGELVLADRSGLVR